MGETFEQTWRKVKLNCAMAPPLLAASWVQEEWNKIQDRRPWSWLRTESTITVKAGRSGTVSAVSGSAVIQGIGLIFTAADVGLQFRIQTSLPWTILSVDVGLNRATIDQNFPGTTTASTLGSIVNAFITMPADFGSFLYVLDPANNMRVRIFVTEEELNYYDTIRGSSGQPRALVSRRFDSSGLVQYELVPYSSAAAFFPYLYRKRNFQLSDDLEFPTPFRDRPDILVERGLMRAAQWPGTEDKKNPYFNLALASQLRETSESEIVNLEARDEEIYMTWLEMIGLDSYPYSSHPFRPGDFRSFE